MQLRGRVVVVTGASAGIGEVTAVAFAKRGAKVVLAARRTERLDELADRIHRAGGSALALTVDVGDPKQLERLPGVIHEAVGPVDVLVNNAGMPGRGRFDSLPYEQIEKVVRVNLLGVLYGSRAFVPGMVARGHGHIVNVGSLAGRFAPPGAALYTETKHAVVAFSESLNLSTAPAGVLVTSVNPAFVPTEGFPNTNRPRLLTLTPERVAEGIVRVVRDGIAPEYSIPRWAAAGQVFRVLTPRLYRWAMALWAQSYEPARVEP